MKVRVNGEVREVAEKTTVLALIVSLGLKPDRVAAELNRQLVRSGGYDVELREGDEVEIVTFAGGG